MKTKQIIGAVLVLAAVAGIGYFSYKFFFAPKDGGEGNGEGGEVAPEAGDTGDGSAKGTGKGFGKLTTKK